MTVILVVDDEPDIRFLLRGILERDGYVVVEAGHGAAALEMVSRQRPDLVVTDMMMPVMGGAELVKRLRSDNATAAIPIVVLSAEAHLATDVTARMAKPFAPQELVAAIHAISEPAPIGD